MVRKVAVIAAVLALALTFVPQLSSAEEALPFEGHVIAIDPGHGGEELGSTACAEYLDDDSMLEKWVNLEMASQLRTKLIDEGGAAEVVMTRTGDDTLDNHARAETVNSSAAEVVVTMHLNGDNNPAIDGLYVLFGRMRKDKAFAQVMHDAMWRVLGDDPDYPDEYEFQDFGIRQFAAGISLWAEVPATLVESVFLSNHWECAQLADPNGPRRQEIVQAIYDGLDAWFNQPQPPPKGKNK